MMNRRLLSTLMVAGLGLAGCSTLDSLNPFSSPPKMAPLPAVTGGSEARTLWSASVGKSDNNLFVPAIVGDAVFAASAKGVLQRLENGRATWKIEVGQPLSAGVGANARVVAVGTAKGEVLAYAADTGALLWRARVSSEVLAAPAVSDAGVAVRSGDNSLFLFDLSDGSRKWVYQRAMPPLSIRSTGSPVFADRYLFAGFPGGKLVALALQNGAPVWEGTVSLPKGTTELDRVADIVAAPVIEGTQICAVAFQGRVACFDMAQGGAMIWSREISSAVGLAIDGRYLFVTDDQGIVYALDRVSGGSLWKQDKLKQRRVSAPAVRTGVVAVADVEGYVHFMTREEGAFIARQKSDGSPVRAPIRTMGDAFLIQTTGGELKTVEVR